VRLVIEDGSDELSAAVRPRVDTRLSTGVLLGHFNDDVRAARLESSVGGCVERMDVS
jgi:hypothetical protein